MLATYGLWGLSCPKVAESQKEGVADRRIGSNRAVTTYSQPTDLGIAKENSGFLVRGRRIPA